MGRYWVELTMSCGHTESVALNCTSNEYDNKLKWYEEVYAKDRVCKDCYKKQMEQEAKAKKEALDLPELNGSPKQVAWADSIRANLISEWETLWGKLDPEKLNDPNKQRVIQIAINNGLRDSALAILNYLKSQQESRYFIDYWNKFNLTQKGFLFSLNVRAPEEKDYNELVQEYRRILQDAVTQAQAQN